MHFSSIKRDIGTECAAVLSPFLPYLKEGDGDPGGWYSVYTFTYVFGGDKTVNQGLQKI